MRKKIAIVIPTYDNFNYVFDCLESIRRTTENYVVYLIDDNSPSWKSKVEKKIRSLIPEGSKIVRFENKDGCTRSWNLGLQFSNEEITVIANSDVLFSKGWQDDVELALSEFSLVGPVTNAPGDIKIQNVKNYVFDYVISDNQEDIDQTNNDLKINPFQVDQINGFFMVARTSDWRANSFDDGCVFDPNIKFLENEIELQERWGGKIGVANCFIFHYKAVSRYLLDVPEYVLDGIHRKRCLM